MDRPTMDEYIARNTAKRWLAFAVGTGVSAAETIDQVPAADVAPVVRCKDCKYYKESRVLPPNKFCFRLSHPTEPGKIGYNLSENDFCSRGVRKDGGDADR